MTPSGISLEKWCENIGREPQWAYPFIKDKALAALNINGKYYITAEADAEFWAAAGTGKFSAPTSRTSKSE